MTAGCSRVNYKRKQQVKIVKIIGKKGYSALKMLRLMTDFLEKLCKTYPLLDDDVEIDITLKKADGTLCPDNDRTVCFDGKEIAELEESACDPLYYYNHDGLTGLYNRGKYERDLIIFEKSRGTSFTCAYIDAVGLHELNNHLGHKAGDTMLCTIADGLRGAFPDAKAYRIGGDEFVVLWFGTEEIQIQTRMQELRRSLKEQEYEISVGIRSCTRDVLLSETVNCAEHAMRQDKAEFYRKNGAERQMRTLNAKLEEILLQNQDASQFLNVIAPRYKGVYMVNPDTDSCRYIYIPKYFEKMLTESNQVFSIAIRNYCKSFVQPVYYERFKELNDYNTVYDRISRGENVEFTYQKLDGNWVRLKITIYDMHEPESREMLWIFVDDN